MRAQSLESKLRPAANDLVTSVWSCHEQRGCVGVMLRFFVFFVICGSTVLTGFALWFCFRNVHVRFWLGDLPVIALAISLAALVPTSVLLIYKISITTHRNAMKAHSRRQAALGNAVEDKDHSWRLSLRTLRFTFMLICLLSLAAVVLGYFVVMSGMEMSGSLMMECGSKGNTKAIESMHSQLVDFQQKKQCSTKASLDSCSGFDEEFPPPAPFASYIKVLEFEQECGGFCKYSAPLFNTGETSNEACARSLGHFLWLVSCCVGVPALVGGTMLAFLSFLLYNYDGL
eukprot:TRINITY_DN12057_c0_g1_i2.p1 TRINITY_DN12057_c0_g1~~TRINITY_DN12057_c0_g1_i2.p1  ORF type:complete len:287 (+),score=60.76 TRINITY_DN12057_c0_g1_i2:193-1053(+)